MDKTQIIIFTVVMVFLAFRLYQKYIKKDNNSTGSNTKPSSGSSFSSSSKDDDYEPYSKKE
jgi:hypothetical protein